MRGPRLPGAMISDRRLDRMRAVLEQRLVHVRCAIEAVHHRHNVSAILRTCDALGVHRVDLVSHERLRSPPGRPAAPSAGST